MAALTPAQHRANHGSADTRSRDADGMAIASFVLGLIGLLLFNVVFGPLALVLGALALVRGTARRGRALLGLTLGAADLILLAVAIATSHGTLLQLGG
ncbi:hypothetical protein GCM10009665_64760 [Kitasatospora nipponensis]|uniref:DUF4190 domain-containing protein n=1 Tax=Kitasatospora nipponensis TaxID=258049 RepID=A0ABN1WXY7_9ACTN